MPFSSYLISCHFMKLTASAINLRHHFISSFTFGWFDSVSSSGLTSVKPVLLKYIWGISQHVYPFVSPAHLALFWSEILIAPAVKDLAFQLKPNRYFRIATTLFRVYSVCFMSYAQTLVCASNPWLATSKTWEWGACMRVGSCCRGCCFGFLF